MAHDQLGLFDTPAEPRQVWFCVAAIGILLAGFLLILPVRNSPLGEVTSFIPLIDAAMLIGELITASLLYGQAIVFRSLALTVLATGYILTSLLLIPHALTFPGAFSTDGLLGAGLNTAGAISLFRRAVFPIAIIVYVMRKRTEPRELPETRPMSVRIAVAILAAIALATALTLIATRGHYLLPTYFLNRADVIYAKAVGIEAMVFALLLVAAGMLFRQRNSLLDIWLLVNLAAWLIQSVLIMTLHGRFSAGWYFLYVLTLFSHLVLLFALIAETNWLYARLAISTSARNRERNARLMTMDAVTAAISHEVGQPLTAVANNANACLHWLDRETPNVEMAMKALRGTIDAGQRTSDVIKSIRAALRREPDRAVELNINDLVRETIALLDRELAGQRISLEFALDEALPMVLVDRVQIQRVLVNLFTNAIESLAGMRGRARRLVIRSMGLQDGDVLLEISDTGIGIAPGQLDRIFEGFFTTKADGTGLGLSICRIIVEEHGGRLWATDGEEYGATLHLRLPRSALPVFNPEQALDSNQANSSTQEA